MPFIPAATQAAWSSPASPASALNKIRAVVNFRAGCLPLLDQRIQTLSFFRTELHDILLYGDLFRGRKSTPSLRYGAIKSDILPDVNDVAD